MLQTQERILKLIVSLSSLVLRKPPLGIDADPEDGRKEVFVGKKAIHERAKARCSAFFGISRGVL
jgi:hypothetical protein